MKIKICHITSVHPQKDIRIFYKECISLHDAGYEVTLIAPGNSEYFDSGIKIIPFPKKNNRSARIFSSSFVMFSLALKQKAVIYHFHDPELILCGMLLRISGKKVIFDIHENVAQSLLQKDWIPKSLRPLIKLIYRFFERIAVLFFSRLILAELSYKKYYPANSVVIQNFPFITATHLPEKQFTPPYQFVYSGVIHATRGTIEMLKIISKLNQDGHESFLHLAGPIRPESYHNVIGQKIKELNIEDKVVYHGTLSVPDSYQLIEKNSFGFALWDKLPNFYECIPTKFYEYLSKGLPVIVPDYPIYHEYVVRLNTGLCIPYHDTAKATVMIEELLQNKLLLKEMSENGKKSVQNTFNWNTQAKILLAEYDKLIHK